MSLNKVASHLAAQGRGPDTTLVHMSPREVGALQTIAKQHGGSLTVNPQTGLAEAGFLDAILPMVAGAGLSMIPGVGPLMAAGIVGAGTGLLTKDLNKGLMAGLGAFGGASLAGSIAGAGAGAGSTAAAAETAAAAGSLYTPAEIASMQAAGLSPAEIATSAADYVGGASGVGTANMPFSSATQSALNNPAMAGLSEISKAPGAFFKKNMFPIGAAAAPLLLGGGDLFGGGEKKEGESNSYIRPYTYSQTRNPNYTGAGTPYFTQSMTPQTPIPASDFGGTAFAEGGIVALADGGFAPLQLTPFGYMDTSQNDNVPFQLAPYNPIDTNRYKPNTRVTSPEVNAYNQRLMERSNQQYNINTPPASMIVPGSVEDTTAKAAKAAQAAQAATAEVVKPADYIDDYYQQMLGRNADPTGRGLIEGAIGKSWYDPARDIPDVIRRSAEFQRSGKNANPTGIEIGKVYSDDARASTNLANGGVVPTNYDPITQRYTSNTSLTPEGGIAALSAYGPGINTQPMSMDDSMGVQQTPSLIVYNPQTQRYETVSPVETAAPAGLPAIGTDQMGYYNPAYGDSGDSSGTPGSEAPGDSPGADAGPDGTDGADGGDYAEGGITNSKMAAVQKYMSQAQSSTQGMQQVLALAKAGDYNASVALNQLKDTPNQNYAMGGIASLGSYSDGGRMLKGPGDGVSDSIPATIGGRQPARLAAEEFVIPARIVSELGNGSSEAGAKRLYGMMERVENAREKSVGNGKIAVDTKAYKHLPA